MLATCLHTRLYILADIFRFSATSRRCSAAGPVDLRALTLPSGAMTLVAFRQFLRLIIVTLQYVSNG